MLKDLNKKHQDGEIDSELYFKRQLSFVREQGLIIKKLQDHLYTQGANSLCQVLEDIKQANCDESIISQKLKAAEQEGKSKSWSQIVSATANDKSMSKIQAAIETAFKVAEYLVEDNN